MKRTWENTKHAERMSYLQSKINGTLTVDLKLLQDYVVQLSRLGAQPVRSEIDKVVLVEQGIRDRLEHLKAHADEVLSFMQIKKE